jgi:L-ascorbate metabolism protein UlaG (beta-lactamase superfamily)
MGRMRLTKFGHACVRVETGGAVLVVDPGAWTEREAVVEATAVLVTHEHPDHLDVDHLAAADAPVVTIAAVADRIAEQAPALAERVQVVSPGARLDVAGVPVAVVGERHAVIHPDLPRFDNSGFLMDLDGTTVFHPGDAFTVPDAQVDVLLLPVHAPWSKTLEVLDFARAVAAPQTVAVHDGLLNERGLALVERIVGGDLAGRGLTYTRVEPGSRVPVA